jgi:hypothetical protein
MNTPVPVLDPIQSANTEIYDPRARRLMNGLKWAMVVCMLALIAECTFLLPYILVRFGWSS